MHEIEKVLKENKTVLRGMRFRPSIVLMLKELAENDRRSMADYMEQLILNTYIDTFKEKTNIKHRKKGDKS